MPVYDFGEQNGQLYLVMGLMSGGSLASYKKALALNNNAAASQMSQAGLDRLGVER